MSMSVPSGRAMPPCGACASSPNNPNHDVLTNGKREMRARAASTLTARRPDGCGTHADKPTRSEATN